MTWMCSHTTERHRRDIKRSLLLSMAFIGVKRRMERATTFGYSFCVTGIDPWPRLAVPSTVQATTSNNWAHKRDRWKRRSRSLYEAKSGDHRFFTLTTKARHSLVDVAYAFALHRVSVVKAWPSFRPCRVFLLSVHQETCYTTSIYVPVGDEWLVETRLQCYTFHCQSPSVVAQSRASFRPWKCS